MANEEKIQRPRPMDAAAAQQAARRMATQRGPGRYPSKGAELVGRTGEFVDLSREIFEGMPLWFGHQRTFIMTNQDHDGFRRIWGTDAGFMARNLLISEHAGTHVDSVLEYDRDGPGIDQLALGFFIGSAVCLDLSFIKFSDPDPDGKGSASAEDIWQAETRLAEAGVAIQPGDIVLCWFDYGDRTYPSQDYTRAHPGLRYDAAVYLAEKGVVNIGSDCVAIDNSLDTQFSAHMACKRFGIVNTEGLANLGRLINRRFTFIGLPLRIRGGTGSPIRALAWLDRGDSI